MSKKSSRLSESPSVKKAVDGRTANVVVSPERKLRRPSDVVNRGPNLDKASVPWTGLRVERDGGITVFGSEVDCKNLESEIANNNRCNVHVSGFRDVVCAKPHVKSRRSDGSRVRKPPKPNSSSFRNQ